MLRPYLALLSCALFLGLSPCLAQSNANLALGKPVTASGTLWPGFPASYLTDGRPETFTHPNISDTLGFTFLIDLQQTVLAERIVITGRGDGCCPERLRRYRVEWLADEDGTPGAVLWRGDFRMDGSFPSIGGHDTWHAEDGEGEFGGRFLRITNLSGEAHNPQIAEVEVYGPAAPHIRFFNATAGNITATGTAGLPATTELTWLVEGADSITLTPDIGFVSTASGSVIVKPATRTIYTLTASRGPLQTTATIVIGVDDPWLPPFISEISADNSLLEDEDGDRPDWIEICNPNPYSVNLAGAALTDDPSQPRQWISGPAMIPPQGYLVVFASGKNKTQPETPLHTNFSLSVNGEYLALRGVDGAIWTELNPFPPSRTNISYGRLVHGTWKYFQPPTPGEPNPLTGADALVAEVTFDPPRGVYQSPQLVSLHCATVGAQIRFTLDGSEPTAETGFVYTAPLAISTTQVVRAAAFAPNALPAPIVTHSYLFYDDVLTSDRLRRSLVEHPVYGPQLRAGLAEVPSVSLVLPKPNAISNDTEVRASVEFLNLPGAEGHQAPAAMAGVKHFGGTYTDFAKKSFRLAFRSRYGTSRLQGPLFESRGDGWQPVESFDALELRNGSHDMVMRGFYLSNPFCDDILAEMGHLQPHGRMVHLYLNGSYHGLYHLRERWSADMLASYLGGSVRDYEAINGNLNVGGWAEPGSSYDGDGSAWERIKQMRTQYEDIAKYVDIDNYLDYMIMWMFGNAEDEYRAAGPRREDGGSGFKFMLNDADGWLSVNANNQVSAWDGSDNNTGRSGTIPGRGPGDGPGSLLSAWLAHGGTEFKIKLADHIHRHLGPGGALSPARNAARLTAMAAAFERPFLAESARWNYRTPESWAQARDVCLTQWIPTRTNTVLNQFRSAGLYPNVPAPLFTPQHGELPALGKVTLTIPSNSSTTLYYTTDGTDPRLPGGSIHPSAQTATSGTELTLTRNTWLRARARSSTGVWSAMTEAFYIPAGGSALPAGSVVVSELHYHPPAGESEFIELLNVSSQPVNLRGARFTSGITYDFTIWRDVVLNPGERLVLVANDFAFRGRYGWNKKPAGIYAGNLANEGERLRLRAADGTVVFDFIWSAAWCPATAGQGRSLTLLSPHTNVDLSHPASWRPSLIDHGTPLEAEGTVYSGSPPDGDDDHDGLTNFAHYALAGSGSLRPLEILWTPQGPLAVFYRWAAATDAEVYLEASRDLITWQTWTGGTRLEQELTEDGLLKEVWTLPWDPNRPWSYVRLRVEPQPTLP